MHPKVLSPDGWKTVRRLAGQGVLEGWTLAGGTALAIQFGHRTSEDLDFFRPEAFEVEDKLQALAGLGRVSVQSRTDDTLHASVDGLRVSFLRTQAPFLFAPIEYRHVELADPRDIAVMKIVAIGGRGSRKDFVDLYFLLESGIYLEGIFAMLRQRFRGIDYNEYHLAKSLVFFEDAEDEPMPDMIESTAWDDVKQRIVDEVKSIT